MRKYLAVIVLCVCVMGLLPNGAISETNRPSAELTPLYQADDPMTYYAPNAASLTGCWSIEWRHGNGLATPSMNFYEDGRFIYFYDASGLDPRICARGTWYIDEGDDWLNGSLVIAISSQTMYEGGTLTHNDEFHGFVGGEEKTHIIDPPVEFFHERDDLLIHYDEEDYRIEARGGNPLLTMEWVYTRFWKVSDEPLTQVGLEEDYSTDPEDLIPHYYLDYKGD